MNLERTLQNVNTKDIVHLWNGMGDIQNVLKSVHIINMWD